MKNNLEAPITAQETGPAAPEEAPRPKKAGPLRPLKLALKLAMGLLLIYFWYAYLHKNWNQLSHLDWKLNWPATILSALLFFVGTVFINGLWAPLLRELTGIPISLAAAFRVSSIAMMGRYIPGKVWSIAGKAYLSAENKAQIPPAGVAATIETLYFQISGLLFAAIIFPLCPKLTFLPKNFGLISVVFVAVSLVLSYPPIFCGLTNTGLKILRQPPLPRRPRRRVLLALMIGYMATYACWSAGFTLLAHAMTPLRPTDLALLMAIFPTAWVMGFLMLLAPGGLGVRESILAVALNQILPHNAALVLSLVLINRIIVTLVEVGCFLFALLMPYLGLGRRNP